jgi:hypothetical protein
MIHVDQIDPLDLIPKRELFSRLEKEAPDFITELLALEIPPPHSRLNIPILITEDKKTAEILNQTDIERFISEKCHFVPGEIIKFSDFYDRFLEFLDPAEVGRWSKIKVGREIPPQFPKGRIMTLNAQFYIGNISWTAMEPTKPKLVCVGDKLESRP